MLAVEEVSCGYGAGAAVRGVSLEVRRGEIVALIGPNGAGKTTLLRTIAGLLAPRSGSILFCAQPIGGAAASRIVRMGLSFVPDRRRVFERLSVRENLRLGAYRLPDPARVAQRLEKVLALFPVLRERAGQLAGTLSGGERQMLAIGRGLMSDPAMLMLDEPSLGLAPNLVDAVYDYLLRLNREENLTLLVAEQNVPKVLSVATRAYLLRSGAVVGSGPAGALAASDELRRTFLGLD